MLLRCQPRVCVCVCAVSASKPQTCVPPKTTGRKFLTKINANIGNSAVSSSIEEVSLCRCAHLHVQEHVCVCVRASVHAECARMCFASWGGQGVCGVRGIAV
jgi:hypothetical protein